VAPNIVFILVGNVGWGNFGVYGGTIPTPRIDKCAGEGIHFNNYNVEVQCTPTIFCYTVDSPAIQSAYLKPQLPMQYDLSSDPHEDSNLWYTDLTQGWIFAPNFRIIIEYERSLREYPNIKVGEDFKGYQK
jgi:hypothetical protein